MAGDRAEARGARDSDAAIVAVISRATHDGRFRSQLRRDPVGTLARVGLLLSPAEWVGLREVLAGQPWPCVRGARCSLEIDVRDRDGAVAGLHDEVRCDGYQGRCFRSARA